MKDKKPMVMPDKVVKHDMNKYYSMPERGNDVQKIYDKVAASDAKKMKSQMKMK